MDYRELTEQEYFDRLRVVVVGAEGLHARSQDVGDGMATIGYGYTFNRDTNARIWRDSGIQLTPHETASLEAIDAAPAADRTRLGLAFARELTAAESELLLRASMRDYEGPANSLSMPLSDERVALVSLTYNRGEGALMGNAARSIPEHPIMGAIRDGDRAEAWFQMRYNCWGSAGAEFEGGLRKRRFAEAEVFGLYDDPNNVSPQEARNVVQMYALHRTEIDRVEQVHGVSIEGDPARRNRIAEANRDYPGLVREYGSVQTIASSLEPARQLLLRQAHEENPTLAERLDPGNFAAGRIHVDPNRDLREAASVDQDLAAMRDRRARAATIGAVSREQRNSTTEDGNADHSVVIDSRRMSREQDPQEIDSNDLLMGMGGNDTLRAHRGDDVLIGGEGRDRMEGGAGRDTYVIGAGDTIIDGDGIGEVHLGGQQLTGGVRSESDPENTYRSQDGRFSYTLEGNNLAITGDLAAGQTPGERAVIENFQSGQLGISLTGPVRAGPTQPERGQRGDAERQRMLEGDRPRDNAIPMGGPVEPGTTHPLPVTPLQQAADERGRGGLTQGASERGQDPDHQLLEKLQDGVRGLDRAANKGWDENSERLSASALVMARKMGFTAQDDLQLAFNTPTGKLAGGELLFVARTGPTASPDPAANLIHMPTSEALSKPAQARYQEVEAIALAQAEQMRMTQQEFMRGTDDPSRAGPKLAI